MMIHGRFIKSNEEFYLFNVYAPCDRITKQALWTSLSSRLLSMGRLNVCLCGDFNSVRSADERRSVRGTQTLDEFAPFNEFIDECVLIDLPLCGRKFTWFKGDGRSMSRLDRFLLSEEWCLLWPNCMQVAHLRGLSDHCPIVLSVDEENWGSRPLRLLKCWQDMSSYNNFVRERWSSLQVTGWGGYVFKEKLKLIKLALKDWHASNTQNLPAKIDSLKNRQATLDSKGEEADLSEDELGELHGISTNIHSLSRLNTSICWQQSRLNWLHDGDANSKFFHSVLANRRRRNSLSTIMVNGTVVEGV